MPKTQYKKGDKKVLRAWAFYDWANSVYALVPIITYCYKKFTLGDKSFSNEETKKIVRNNKLDLALVSPPCQGMSKNGRGKLLSEIKAGRRPKEDPRNALIIKEHSHWCHNASSV